MVGWLFHPLSSYQPSTNSNLAIINHVVVGEYPGMINRYHKLEDALPATFDGSSLLVMMVDTVVKYG